MNTLIMYSSRIRRLSAVVLNRYINSSSLEDISKQNSFCDTVAEGGEKKSKESLKGKQCTFYVILKKTMLFKRKKQYVFHILCSK